MNIDVNKWLSEAKAAADARECGMYLIHNGVVRVSAKKAVRENEDMPLVTAMDFSYDQHKLDDAVKKAEAMDGIRLVRVAINSGRLNVGDDLMYILVGGDIRTRVVACLEALLNDIKGQCVIEKEIY